MKHLHLIPAADAAQDAELVAAVAHAEALAETQSPRAAIRAAFRAGGVDALEERYDALRDENAALKARLARVAAELGLSPDGAAPQVVEAA